MTSVDETRRRLLELRPRAEGPLGGAIVLDFTINMAGPFCTLLLADLGALVIKIESLTGEPHRWIGAGDGAMGRPWALVNRDKLSLALDLKDADERAAWFEPLVAAVDIVVHNFKPTTATRLGIDAASIRGLNPSAIHCAISGFGSSAEGEQLAGVDIVAEAYAGLASVTALPGDGPVKIGVPMGDVSAGMLATIEILGRWIERTADGRATPAEVALVDGTTTFGTFNLALAAGGQVVGAVGRDHQFMAPYGYYRTGEDGWIALGLATDRHWSTLCELLGRPELEHDARFATLERRWEGRVELRQEVERALEGGTALEWEDRLAAAGLPCAAARTYDQVIASPLLQERGLLEHVEEPELGDAIHLYPLSYGRGTVHGSAQVLGGDKERLWQSLTGDE